MDYSMISSPRRMRRGWNSGERVLLLGDEGDDQGNKVAEAADDAL